MHEVSDVLRKDTEECGEIPLFKEARARFPALRHPKDWRHGQHALLYRKTESPPQRGQLILDRLRLYALPFPRPDIVVQSGWGDPRHSCRTSEEAFEVIPILHQTLL